MYKLVITHELLPGRLPDFIAWFTQFDEEQAKEYPGLKSVRYISVFGSGYQIVAEMELEKLPEQAPAYAEQALTQQRLEFLGMIVPGSTEVKLFKQIS